MYSLNAPVPASVERVCVALQTELSEFTPRTDPALVCKRLDTDRSPTRFDELKRRLSAALAGTPAIEARVEEIDLFEHPPSGSRPVVYLRVESPGLETLHSELCSTFPPVPEIEGEDYTPHITVARGGPVATARRVTNLGFDPITWTVSELRLYDARHGEPVSRYALPQRGH